MGELSKPWPRPTRWCEKSDRSLREHLYFFSALILQQGRWVRVDLSPESFQEWKLAQPELVAWWKSYRSSSGSCDLLREQTLELLEQLIERCDLGSSSSEEPSPCWLQPDQPLAGCIFRFALALHRKRWVQLQLQQDRFELLLDSGRRLLMPVGCAEGPAEELWQQLRERLGLQPSANEAEEVDREFEKKQTPSRLKGQAPS